MTSRKKRIQAHAPYKVPTVLDATVCIFMEHFRTGRRLYDVSFTFCQEKFDANTQLFVGGFIEDCLHVNSYDWSEYGYDPNGIGGLRSRAFDRSISPGPLNTTFAIVPKHLEV